MSKTKTSNGLKVFKTGRNVADGFKENMKIKFDEFSPQWNYVAVPSRRF